MRLSHASRHAIICLAVFGAGCAAVPQDRVVLLPGANGKVGAIAVNPGQDEIIINAAYASAAVDSEGELTQAHSSAGQINQQFLDAKCRTAQAATNA